MTFGKKKDLLALARWKMRNNPGKYVDHIYGENEVGGTSWLYLASEPFDAIGFPKLGTKPPPRLTEAIQQADQVLLALSPEGTRSKTEFWRSGFYHIANKIQVPIHFGFIDYPSKTIGVHPGFVPTGDVEADLEKIRAFYKDKRGKHPENVGPIKFRDKS